jgi:hypothetical protein
MPKYFSVTGFCNLIRVLEDEKVRGSYKSEFENDIEVLYELKTYDNRELDSGDYITEKLKIKVIVHYFDIDSFKTNYQVELK